MTATIHEMPEAVYHDNCGDTDTPLFSSSIGKIIETQSVLHAWAAHPLLGGRGRKTTAAMSEGKIVDALICGDVSGIAVTDEWGDFKTKDAQAWRDNQKALGRTPIVRAKFREYEAAAKVMRKRLDDAGCVLTGLWQPVILFELRASNGNAVKCKARLDHLDPLTGLVTDIKKAESAKPGRLLSQYVYRYGYDVQAAMYPLAVEQLTPDLVGRSRFEWAFVEAEFPNAVLRAPPSGTMRAVGAARLQRAVDKWEQALRTDTWPGYDSGQQVEAQNYMLEDAMIEEVSE